VDYALDDVCSLLALRDALHDRLTGMGRLEWAQQEFRDLEATAAQPPPGDDTLYLRVRGCGKLGRRGLAVLRELAAWREAEARNGNVPRNRVLRDEVLVELARHSPTDPGDLGGARWASTRAIRAHAEAIIAAVARGLAVPKKSLPHRLRAAGAGPDGVIELMQAVARKRAEEREIAVHLLATRADLARLHQHVSGQADPDLPLLHGWRWDLVGRDLVGLLEGRLSVGIDPATGYLRLFSTER